MNGPGDCAGRLARPATAAGVLLVLLVLFWPLAALAAAEDWRDVLERTTERSRERAYAGEVLWVSYMAGRPYLTRADVRNEPGAGLVVDSEGGLTLQVDDAGGDVVHHGEGWSLALPDATLATGDPISDLEDKYEVRIAATERLLDRRCTRIDIRRREDAALRERLWIDDRSGLLLRRETYSGDEVVRLVSYLSLDLQPPSRDGHPAPDERPPLDERGHGAASVDDGGLDALREAGWTVPEDLPGDYQLVSAYAVAAEDSQPLHVVYGDGLYAVSVFQQEGQPDWQAMPAGAQRLEDVEGEVYAWPGAIPQRYVWTVDGRTWSVVTDAPSDDLRAILDELPQPHSPGLLERLGRGLGRLWSWVSPWG